MKKLLTLLFALAFTFAFYACNNSAKTEESNDTQEVVEQAGDNVEEAGEEVEEAADEVEENAEEAGDQVEDEVDSASNVE